MPTYEKAKQDVRDMALSVLREFQTHIPILNAKVTIDFIMAYGARDEDGHVIGDAIRHGGVKALGLCRIVKLKDRVKCHGDAEVTLDGDWWANAMEPEQRALLDHELHHISVCINQANVVKQDEIGRPKLKMRKHDYQFGWFTIIAQRHGIHAQECQQAKQIAENNGQFYWPDIANQKASSIPALRVLRGLAQASEIQATAATA